MTEAERGSAALALLEHRRALGRLATPHLPHRLNILAIIRYYPKLTSLAPSETHKVTTTFGEKHTLEHLRYLVDPSVPSRRRLSHPLRLG